MRAGIMILKLVPDGVLCASQNFDRCHGSRNFCLLETTLVFVLQKLRFDEPAAQSAAGSIITIQTKQIPCTATCRVFVWSARWDSNPPPSESESDTLSK